MVRCVPLQTIGELLCAKKVKKPLWPKVEVNKRQGNLGRRNNSVVCENQLAHNPIYRRKKVHGNHDVK